MAKQVVVLTGLLVVLMAAGRAGIHADSSLTGPIIPMPLAEATGPQMDLVNKTQTPAETPAPASPAPAGEMADSIVIPGTAFKVMHLFQYDSARPGQAQTQDKPVSVIMWKALEIGSKVPVAALRDRISENSALPSMTSKAVYALQSDYRLQRLALSAADIDHLFALLKDANGEAIAADPTWKGKVASQLKEVEWLDDGPRKNKSKSAKAGKAKTSKATKQASKGKSGSTKSVKMAKKTGKSTAKSAKKTYVRR